MFSKFLLQFYLFLSCLKVYNYILKGADSMPLPKEHTYTIKDIYVLPEGERAELIDGLFRISLRGRRCANDCPL